MATDREKKEAAELLKSIKSGRLKYSPENHKEPVREIAEDRMGYTVAPVSAMPKGKVKPPKR